MSRAALPSDLHELVTRTPGPQDPHRRRGCALVRRATRLRAAAIAITLLVPALTAGPAQADTSTSSTTEPLLAASIPDATTATSLLVGVAPDADAATESAIARAAGAQRSARVAPSVVELTFAPGTLRARASQLRGRSDVRYVEPNAAIHSSKTPDDPGFPVQWQLQSAAPAIGAPAAWSHSTGSSSIVVGVLDSGIDLNHPDLRANLWSNPGGVGGCATGTHGINLINGGCTPQDGFGHGTHVSGTIGAVGNNNQGVTGIAWTTRPDGDPHARRPR